MGVRATTPRPPAVPPPGRRGSVPGVPVLLMFSVKGDPARLLEAYDQRLRPAVAAMGGEAPLSHACVQTGEGMMIVDVWESEAALQSFMDDPRFREVVDAVPGDRPQVRILRVHRFDLPRQPGPGGDAGDQGAGASRSP
mgnify:CR=1 FL=1